MSKHRRALYLGKSTRHKASACLDCGAVLDASTGVGNKAKPHAGAITMCIKCGHLMVYAWDMSLRPLSDKETVEVAGDERIVAMSNALKRTHRAYERAHIMLIIFDWWVRKLASGG